MHGPEYLCYCMIGVYPAEAYPILPGCKDNAFVSQVEYLRGSSEDGRENDDEERCVEKIYVFIR